MYEYDDYYVTEEREGNGAVGLALLLGFLIIRLILAMFVNPILLDSVIFAFGCGFFSCFATTSGYFGTVLELHPAIYILIGLAAGTALYFLQITPVGFWVVSILFSAFKTIIIACFVYCYVRENTIWVYLSIAPSFAGLLWLRIRDRKTAWDAFHLKYRLA